MVATKVSALGDATLTDDDLGYIADSGNPKKFSMAQLRTLIAGKGILTLDIAALREIGLDTANEISNAASHGGILSADTAPSLKRVNLATDKALFVNWPLADVTELQFPPIPMPMDLDETADVTLHFIMDMDGATDTPTVDVQVFDGVGDVEMGGPTGALSTSAAELVVTLLAADITGNPLGYLNVALTPGTHGTDAIRLRAAWGQYIKKAAT